MIIAALRDLTLSVLLSFTLSFALFQWQRQLRLVQITWLM